ncbi:MAG TPA: ABC transporter permease [Burkholderiaceae bacterium]|nr:ABC transporter permease [Burkholderiaceae bacterium]
MSTAGLLLASLRARPGATLLTVLLVALGLATATIVTLATTQLEARLERDARGVDLVVGAKGSRLQLVLAGVWHLDVPPGNVPLAAVDELRAMPGVAQAIPLALGDSFRGFRIVGTEPAFVELQRARLARGAPADAPMRAVLGADVAAATGLDVGARFAGTHGLAEGGAEHGEDAFTVSGVLAPTGGVVDRLILTPLESVWRVHEGEPADDEERRELEASREVTMVLVRYATPLAAATLPRRVDASDRLQAASPALEAARLFRLVGVGLDGARAFGALLLAMAALSVFVALFQALSDRRRELALMRLLGASPARLFGLLVGEGLATTALGAALGVALGHGAVELAGAWLAPRGELPLTGRDFATIEWAWIGGTLALGALAAAVPARLAARTPPADVLADD